MSAAEIITILASVSAVIGSALAIYKMRRVEGPASDVDVAAKYQAIAAVEASNNVALKKRVDELEARQNEIEAAHIKEIAAIRQELAEEREYNRGLEEHLDYLVDLMRTHGMQPAKQRPSRKRPA